MPTSGASSHSSPSAVSPPVTGYADSPIAAISTVTSTTSPIAEKSERGSVRPGSRASSARFAAVSRPVYASIASGSAKARSPHSWPLAKPKPSRSVSGERRNAAPSSTSTRLDDQVEDRDRERARVQARVPEEAHAGDRRDDEAADHRVPGRLAERLRGQRGAEVVRQEERGQRHHDQVVEEERPARDEAGEVVERPPHEGRRAARLRKGRRALGVGQRHHEEQKPGQQQHERCQPERLRGDDPERDVQRGGDLAVGHGEERGSVEDTLEPAELARHQTGLLRSMTSRPTPSAMKSPPSTNPTTPPPSTAVLTSSAQPIATNAIESTTIATR